MASSLVGRIFCTLFRFLAGLLLAPFGYGKEVALCVLLIGCTTWTIASLQTWCSSRELHAGGSNHPALTISRVLHSPQDGEIILFRDLRDVSTVNETGDELWQRTVPALDQFQFGRSSTEWSFLGNDQNGLFWWNSLRGDVIEDFPIVNCRPKDVSLSGDGRTVAILDDSQTVHLWRLNEDGAAEIRQRRLATSSHKVSLSTFGRRLAVRTIQHELQFIDLSAETETGPLVSLHDMILAQAWSGDENWYAAGMDQRQVLVWRTNESASPAYTCSVPQVPWSLALSADGSWLFIGSSTGELAGWHEGKVAWTRLAHAGGIRALDLSPDGRNLVSGCLQGQVLIHDATTGKLLREVKVASR